MRSSTLGAIANSNIKRIINIPVPSVLPTTILAIPLNFSSTIDFNVWGTFNYSLDGGTTFSSVSGQPFNISGIPSANIIVKDIGNDITRISFSLKNFFSSIVINEPTGSITSCISMFSGCSSLTSLSVVDFNTINVSTINSFSGMFKDCSGLTSLDVTNFNTASATSLAFNHMFSGCSGLTSLDVSGFNTLNATSSAFNGMFFGCVNLTSLDLSSFNTAGATNDAFDDTFSGCTNLICITNIDTTPVGTNKLNMFLSTPALLNPNQAEQDLLTSTNGSNYVNANPCPSAIIIATPLDFTSTIDFNIWGTIEYSLDGGISYSSGSGQPFNISGIPSGDIIVKDIGNDITRISFVSKNFFNAIVINAPTGSITSCLSMFNGCSDITSLDITNLNTTNVVGDAFDSMFQGCINITSLDLSGLTTNLPSLTADAFREMFAGCPSLTCITNINTTTIGTTKVGMFTGASSLVNPTASEITQIISTNGLNYTNANSCP